MTIPRNKLSVINNPYQSKRLRILTVCSGGVLRSPTAAALLTVSGYNTRSCGTENYALIRLSQELVYWADEIIVAEHHHQMIVESVCNDVYLEDEPRPIIRVLGIPDEYDYMDETLQKLLLEKFKQWGYLS